MSKRQDAVQKSIALEALLDSLGPNAVVYSEEAWAVARKSSSGGMDHRWFPDHGAHATRSMNSGELLAWVRDWEVLRDGKSA